MFQSLLIANRGEVAVRVARACRELGVAPIGVASEADRDAGWTRAMDEVVCLGPASATQSYLDPLRVVQAAVQTRCSALHPGWGFLAESPRLATLCRQFGVSFVGPSAATMRRMGLKSPAKQAARDAGLPVVPGSDGPLADADAAVACANETGYPVILKADAGGGGRGMRLCQNADEVRAAFDAASAEAQSAFGSGAMYLERFLTSGRHIEVQVLCDRLGNGVHLFERDCSIQRRHQKLIEEGPSPLLDDDARAELGALAIRAALAMGYENAGTIEFLRDGDGTFHFLEMNTRLQVEHPVTELITGVDIVKKQIEVAAHRPLGLTQADVTVSGHALECRINAEDPAQGFRPTPGRLASFAFDTEVGPGTVRVDTHLAEGEEVSPHYDSLLAKVIVHGETRAAAIETMQAALAAARIEGVQTTLPVHQAVLASPEFQRGDFDMSSIPGFEERAAEAGA
jgi:acetyl-CoA carboxylase biotin carboxylase subunit